MGGQNQQPDQEYSGTKSARICLARVTREDLENVHLNWNDVSGAMVVKLRSWIPSWCILCSTVCLCACAMAMFSGEKEIFALFPEQLGDIIDSSKLAYLNSDMAAFLLKHAPGSPLESGSVVAGEVEMVQCNEVEW